MVRSIDLRIPILSVNDYSRRDTQEYNTSKQDIELAKELIQRLKAFEKRGLVQRLAIAAFVTGAPGDTSWMKEGAKEAFSFQEPNDRCYKICKIMASQGFIRAMHFGSMADNVQAEAESD